MGKIQQMYCFGIDGMFSSGNFVVISKVNVKATAKVKGRRAKIIVQGTSTGHGKY